MKLKMKLKHRDPRKRHDIEFRWLWSSGLTGATVVVTNTVARADRNRVLCIGLAVVNSTAIDGYPQALLNAWSI